MRITVLFDDSTWTIGHTGAFGVRYTAMTQKLIEAGHTLTLVKIHYGLEAPQFTYPDVDCSTVAVEPLAVNRTSKLIKVILDVISPRRKLPHDSRLNEAISETNPDVVIAIMARNPKVVRNLSRKNPIMLIVEEDFSAAWDSTSKFEFFLKPLLSLRNRALQRTWIQPHTAVVISDREIAWARRAFRHSRVITIPLFLKEEVWLQAVEPIGIGMDMFAIGNFDALRNSYGLLKFLDALQSLRPMNTPKVHVACYFPLHPILGEVPASRLEFLGRIDDPRPYYADAKICLSPSLSVSGAKNQILQGWATDCPVMATSQSAESVNGTDGMDLLIGNNPLELAKAALAALEDGNLRSHLAVNGKKSLTTFNSRETSLNLFLQEVERLK